MTVVGAGLPVGVNTAYNIEGGKAIRLLELEFNLLIEGS